MSNTDNAPIEARDVSPAEARLALRDAEHLTVIYFWGPDCPNCDIFKAALPGLLEELAGEPVRVLKLNAYQHRDFAGEFGLRGIPTFYLYRAGERIGRMSQYRGREFFLGVIRDHLPNAA